MAQRIELNPFAKSPTTRTRYVPPIDNALRSSFETLKKQLRLAERARSAGAENLPSGNDKDLDEPQLQVRSATQAGVNLLKQFGANQMNGAEGKIKALGQRTIDTQLALARAAADAGKAKQAAAEVLENARLAERLSLRGWRKFRRDNGLTRKADYAEAVAWPWVITGGMIVADGVVNAGLYMNATDGGLAAGGGLAMLFSAITVAAGFCAGFFGLRMLGHVKPLPKISGAMIFASLFAGGAYWNLVVAKYRDDLAQGSEQGLLKSAAHAADGSGVSHASPEALGLMIIGGLIFLFAILKGRGGHIGFTDPYWGYKAVDIDRRRAEDVYKAEKDAYRAAVAAAYGQAAKQVRDLHAANEADLLIAREAAKEAEERSAEVRDSIGEWIADGGAALRYYREENTSVRTLAAPGYFHLYPTFAEMADGLTDASAVRQACDALIAAHEKAGAEIAAFERQLTRDAEAETKRFLDEVAEIEKRAEARLAGDFSERNSTIDGLDELAAAPLPTEPIHMGPPPSPTLIN